MKHKDQNMIAATILRKSVLCSALLLAGAMTAGNALAVATLPTGSVLMFDPGVRAATNNAFVTSGSYFGMDTNGDSKIESGERTPIAAYFGVPIGIVTSATGSHTGFPDGSENIGIDQPWSFFGNTGMDFVTSPVTQLSTTTLDFSGWRVTWNAIPAIDMGTNAWQPLNCSAPLMACTGETFSNGAGNLTWGGANGGAFTLNYAATVPANDPSGFGGVHYFLHLTGTVIEPGPLTTSGGTLAPGITGVAGYRLGDTDLAAHNIPQDPDPAYQYPLHLYYDFSITSAPGTVNVVIPLASPLPAKALYRKYNPNTRTWGNFDTSGGNAVSSAPGSPGTCASGLTYTPGLTQGNYCVELTIVDNGTNDSNPTAGAISDPGGIATGTLSATTDTRTSGTSGCSLSPTPVDPLKRGDWWLLLGFVAWLGWYRRKRQH